MGNQSSVSLKRKRSLICAALVMLAAGIVPWAMGGSTTQPTTREKAGTQADAMTVLRGLAGTWVGVAPPKEGGKPMTIVFKSTAMDSAVIETMFPGEEHEMVNMYHADGDSVIATHYCAMGNQPRMRLASIKDGVLNFQFIDSANLKSRDEMHMDSLELTIQGDRLTEKWSSYMDGKVAGTETFEFKRQR